MAEERTKAMASDGDPVTLKASAETCDKVYECTSARTVAGQFGPQIALRTKAGHVIYVSADKSGIGKGLNGEKLKLPLRVTATKAFGTKGVFYTWTLAPKAA